MKKERKKSGIQGTIFRGNYFGPVKTLSFFLTHEDEKRQQISPWHLSVLLLQQLS